MKKKFLLPTSAKGQSLVELAISLVILLYLISGAVEFGIALFQYVQLRDAAQEGALFGSISPKDPLAIEARVRASSSSPLNLSAGAARPVTIKIYVQGTKVSENGVLTADGGNATWMDANACESSGLRVEVSFQHHIFMPFLPQILNIYDINLRADVTDTILRPICS